MRSQKVRSSGPVSSRYRSRSPCSPCSPCSLISTSEASPWLQDPRPSGQAERGSTRWTTSWDDLSYGGTWILTALHPRETAMTDTLQPNVRDDASGEVPIISGVEQ